MAQPHMFMREAFANAHGQLHRELGIPLHQKIPVARLRAAVKKGGRLAKRAQLVLNADHVVS